MFLKINRSKKKFQKTKKNLLNEKAKELALFDLRLIFCVTWFFFLALTSVIKKIINNVTNVKKLKNRRSKEI